MKLWHLGSLFALALAVFVIATLPLSAVAGWASQAGARLSYTSAQGSIWSGQLKGTVLGPLALGDVTIAVRPLDLLMARMAADIRFRGAGLSGGGVVKASLSGALQIEGVRVAGDLSDLPTVAPMNGPFSADVAILALSAKGCSAADGTVAADPFVHDGSGREGWSSPPLTGDLSCADGVLTLPLSGVKGEDRVAATASLKPGNRYDIDLEIRTQDQRATGAMLLMGFEDRNGAYAFREQGVWRGLGG